MEYNKRTMFNRRKRCELEDLIDSWIPYAGYKARSITDELMDDDAVKVLTAFQQYCRDGEKSNMKDEFLNVKLKKLIAVHTIAKKFMANLKNILENG